MTFPRRYCSFNPAARAGERDADHFKPSQINMSAPGSSSRRVLLRTQEIFYALVDSPFPLAGAGGTWARRWEGSSIAEGVGLAGSLCGERRTLPDAARAATRATTSTPNWNYSPTTPIVSTVIGVDANGVVSSNTGGTAATGVPSGHPDGNHTGANLSLCARTGIARRVGRAYST